MGDGKRKQANRASVLRDNPRCIYCGGHATTTDHCPPRGFFLERRWPEGYEFSACHACNQEARADEAVLGVLVRIRLAGSANAQARAETRKLFNGLRNNQPKVVEEWHAVSSRREVRDAFRHVFGDHGDLVRLAGYDMISMGPLTMAAIGRFVVKLGKALHYRHNGTVFDGVLYTAHLSSLEEAFTAEFLETVASLAPHTAKVERGGQPLADQFIYRFDNNPHEGLLSAVVRFSEQMIFAIIGLGAGTDARLRETTGEDLLPDFKRHECRLAPV